MCSDKRSPNKAEILKDIDRHFKPDFDLKALVGGNISFVLTTQLLGEGKSACVFPEDQREIWRSVFMKAGYTSDEFSSMPFSTDIPSKFKDFKTRYPPPALPE